MTPPATAFVPTSGVYPFSHALTAGQTRSWVPHFLFDRPTPTCERVSVHVSGLLPGKCPHPPHVHPEEEFLVVLRGEASLVLASGPSTEHAVVQKLPEGGGVYYPPTQHHTIRNDSTEPIEYLMVKWVGRDRMGPSPDGRLGMRTFSYSDRREAKGFVPLVALDSPALRLRRMHTHLTVLGPGAGYGAHCDPYDVAIVLLDGTVRTLGREITAPALVWHDRGAPHGIRNAGPAAARYVVFELEAAA
jgi:mannose-6-phosphate isomerase-like protein (cupin superfamily)